METSSTKELVRNSYGEIARSNGCCCGPRTAASTYADVGETYAQVPGYVPEADLGLGCGLPTLDADLQPGQTVVDLGSGAGNDAFVARQEVGETGRVIGVDFTPEMIARAEANRAKLGFTNVEFRQGEIEDLPLADKLADVVISNCVLNLVPNKVRAFAEILRVLKPGGRFSVSDIVLEGALPDHLRQAAEFHVGCIAGALQKAEYLAIIESSGFTDIRLAKEREIHLPDADLAAHLSPADIQAYRASRTRILSITVKASRPDGCCDRTRCCQD